MPSQRLSRSPSLMSRDESALLIVDLQDRLLKAQPDAKRVVWNNRRLVDGAKAVGVEVAATEQVPEKLGATTADLAARLRAPLAKQDFSAGACDELLVAWRERGVRHVVLAGIETHICVAQTALDLVAAGFEPQIAIDAVGSRYEIDHQTALRRLESLSVTLTTTEAVLFEWCETADNTAFKAISALAKETEPS